VESFSPLETGVVDQENRVVKDVVLCGSRSRNGYALPDQAFGDALNVERLYKGKRVFIDHGNPDEINEALSSRSISELGGRILNAYRENGVTKGDVEAFRTEAGDKLLMFMTLNPPVEGVGFSHVAAYTFGESSAEVKTIRDVLSVDLVVGAATTKTVFSEKQESKKVDEGQIAELRLECKTQKQTIETLNAENATLKGDLKTLKESHDVIKQENTVLKQENEAWKQEKEGIEKQTAIESELKEAGFPLTDTKFCSEAFMKQLNMCQTSADRVELIKDRKEFFGESSAPESHGVEGNGYVPERQEHSPKKSDFNAEKALDILHS
jgi:FtsZ-binding cell division protein ZapB